MMISRTGWVERCIAVEAGMLLAALVTPALRESSHHQMAQRAARAIRIVCAAAATAHARTGEWPQDGVPGRAPEAMKPYLPAGFTFQTSGYRLDWDHWTLSDGPESFSPTSQFQGVSVSTRDPRTLRLIVDALGGERTHFTVGDRTTVVIPDIGRGLD